MSRILIICVSTFVIVFTITYLIASCDNADAHSPGPSLVADLRSDVSATAARYPNERPATGVLLRRALPDTAAYWTAHGGLGPCADQLGNLQATFLFADSLLDADGVDASGRGMVGECLMWLEDDWWLELEGLAAGDDPYLVQDASELAWYLVAHELGHGIGYQHQVSGLMCGPPAATTCAYEDHLPAEGRAFGRLTVAEAKARNRARVYRAACRQARYLRRHARSATTRQKERKRARVVCRMV